MGLFERLKDLASAGGSAVENWNPLAGQNLESLGGAAKSASDIFSGTPESGESASGLDILKQLPSSVLSTILEPASANLDEAVREEDPLRRAALGISSIPVLGAPLRAPEQQMLSGFRDKFKETGDVDEATKRGIADLIGGTAGTVLGPESVVAGMGRLRGKPSMHTNLTSARELPTSYSRDGFETIGDVREHELSIPDVDTHEAWETKLHEKPLEDIAPLVDESQNIIRNASDRRKQQIAINPHMEQRFAEGDRRSGTEVLDRISDPTSKYAKDYDTATLVPRLQAEAHRLKPGSAIDDHPHLKQQLMDSIEERNKVPGEVEDITEMPNPEEQVAGISPKDPSLDSVRTPIENPNDGRLYTDDELANGVSTEVQGPTLENLEDQSLFDTENPENLASIGDINLEDTPSPYSGVGEANKIIRAAQGDKLASFERPERIENGTEEVKKGDRPENKGEQGSILIKDPHEGKFKWGEEWLTPDELEKRFAKESGTEYAEEPSSTIDTDEGPINEDTLPPDHLEELFPEAVDTIRKKRAEGMSGNEDDISSALPGKKKAPKERTSSVASEEAKEIREAEEAEKGSASTTTKDKLPELDFAGMVNASHASEVFGRRIKGKLEALRSVPLSMLAKYQRGELKGTKVAALIRSVTDELHDLSTKSGIKLGKVENYLPGLYDSSHLTAQQHSQLNSMSKKLGLKPGYALEKIFTDYDQAQSFGLKPKFDNLPDMIESHAKSAFRAAAYRKYWNHLKQNKLISTRPSPTMSTIINPNHFPITKDRRAFYTSPTEAVKIENYFREFGGPGKHAQNFVKGTAEVQKYIKNTALAAGVPRTSINAHGLAIAAQRLASGPDMLKNPVQATKNAAKVAGDLFSQERSKKFIADNLEPLQEAIESGMTFSSEEHAMNFSETIGKEKTGLKKFAAGQKWLFEDPLFQNVLPSAKLEGYINTKEALIKAGVPEKEARSTAAHQQNEAFGGTNTEELGRSKATGHIAQVLLTAPDWLESQGRLTKGMLKSLKDPKSPQGHFYRRTMKNMMAMYALGNVISLSMNGKLMLKNSTGNESGIDLGKDEMDKDRTLMPWGQSTNWTRVAHDATLAIANGRYDKVPGILTNRLSGLAQLVLAFSQNRNYQGDPILGRTKFGRPQTKKEELGNVADVATDILAPQQASAVYRKLRGKASTEEAVVKGLELPVKYNFASKSDKKYNAMRR